ncbi:MAG: hypothetical protein V2G41_09895 [bacterium JZ-2024 1]
MKLGQIVATQEDYDVWLRNLLAKSGKTPATAPQLPYADPSDPWWMRVDWTKAIDQALRVQDAVVNSVIKLQMSRYASRAFLQPAESVLNNPITWVFLAAILLLLVAKK